MSNSSNASSDVDMRSFIGKTLKESYLLQEYIFEGNFGAVYKSAQYFLDVPVRRVAVKISKKININIKIARDIFADAFLLAHAMDEMDDAEARSHLVHVYDVGILRELDNRLFVVMEYIQGTTLAAQFRSYKRVPANLMIKWARQICRAVAGLHDMIPPVLHRDLKPDNILLGIDRTVRVVDFGLAAKLMHHGYVPGVAGTTAYMAPETMKGESIPASDVYSIGTLLYEALTGSHPFGHLVPPIDLPNSLESDWIYNEKEKIKPDSPSKLNNTVTPEMEGLIMRCLEFNASRRYINAGALLRALQQKEKADPADVQALQEGKELMAANDLEGARASLEIGMSKASSSKENRFHLTRKLAEVMDKSEEHAEAVTKLVEAWKLTESGAILRTREKRAQLLEQIVQAYRKIGNEFQAIRYENEIKKEL